MGCMKHRTKQITGVTIVQGHRLWLRKDELQEWSLYNHVQHTDGASTSALQLDPYVSVISLTGDA